MQSRRGWTERESERERERGVRQLIKDASTRRMKVGEPVVHVCTLCVFDVFRGGIARVVPRNLVFFYYYFCTYFLK